MSQGLEILILISLSFCTWNAVQDIRFRKANSKCWDMVIRMVKDLKKDIDGLHRRIRKLECDGD